MSNFKVGDRIKLRQDYPNDDIASSFPHGFFNYDATYTVEDVIVNSEGEEYIKIDGSYIEWMAKRFCLWIAK